MIQWYKNDTMIQWYKYTKMIQWYNDAIIQKWYNSTMIQWYKKKNTRCSPQSNNPPIITSIETHHVQLSVKQSAYNYKYRGAPCAALSQTIHYNYKSQDRLTIPVCQTIHPHTVSSNDPQYTAGWNGARLCGVGLVGTDIPWSGVSRRTGSVWPGWAGSARMGCQTWRQYNWWNKEQ